MTVKELREHTEALRETAQPEGRTILLKPKDYKILKEIFPEVDFPDLEEIDKEERYLFDSK
jgi:hypothetical protein